MTDPHLMGETELLQRPNKVSLTPPPNKMWLMVWAGIALLGSLLGVVVVGVFGYSSESDGMTAATVVSAPMGFVWGGTLGAILGFTALKDKVTARRAAPAGCGCGCAGFLFFGVVLFFQVIWPSL